ncbi:MAG: HRDC domain-containing protein [Euryarchaeota archaeon]|nr:HRDC domain-containing protein [Euryarchaeota archaeon]
MKCKVFHVPMPVTRPSGDVSSLNEFLESVKVSRIFSSVVGERAASWSVLVFYEGGPGVGGLPPPGAAVPEKPGAGEPEKGRDTSPPVEEIPLTPSESRLYQALSAWRKQQAAKEGVPPYIVAPNVSLRQLARSGAGNREDLRQIKGVGQRRIDRYGDDILRVVRESAAE